jgi:hypothetical protein
MPLPVKSRRYDSLFWDELLGKSQGRLSTQQANTDLGFGYNGKIFGLARSTFYDLSRNKLC